MRDFLFFGRRKKLACSLGSNGGSLPVLLRGKREGWQGVGTIGSYWGVLPKSATEMALPKINLFDINFWKKNNCPHSRTKNLFAFQKAWFAREKLRINSKFSEMTKHGISQVLLFHRLFRSNIFEAAQGPTTSHTHEGGTFSCRDSGRVWRTMMPSQGRFVFAWFFALQCGKLNPLNILQKMSEEIHPQNPAFCCHAVRNLWFGAHKIHMKQSFQRDVPQFFLLKRIMVRT